MLTPYLTFHGNCADALAFYQEVFGGVAQTPIRYGSYVPQGLDPVPEHFADWIMHAEINLCGTNVWLADEPAAPVVGDNVRLSASVPTAEHARAIFDALARNGQVRLPPTETFYSTFHAAVVDPFGIHWNVVAEESPKGTETS
ncbi:VOC family protein [Ruminococcaceae bacterium OttesenSCG-928-I18]|nr:VOC family protein [Ruminococcaceae bacterium OttesenSCG-928-I18]